MSDRDTNDLHAVGGETKVDHHLPHVRTLDEHDMALPRERAECAPP